MSCYFCDHSKSTLWQIFKIWNKLAIQARNDFIVLFGDDIILIDKGWQTAVVSKFCEIPKINSLPFGAACVALNDTSFEGFPTFPIIHRWHMRTFDTAYYPGNSLTKVEILIYLNCIVGGMPLLFRRILF